MKISRFAFIALSLARPVAPSSSAVQDYAAIDAITAREQKRFGLKCVTRTWPKVTWPLGHELAPEADHAQLRAAVELWDAQLSRYPPSFIHKLKLRTVVFAKKVAVEGQLRTAVPDPFEKVLVLDYARAAKKLPYRRHSFNHEMYHIIETTFNKDFYFKDPAWAKLNAPKFRYGAGGVKSQSSKKFGYVLGKHPRGFVSYYATSALEEDKAETFGMLMTSGELSPTLKLAGKDPVVAAKVKYMQRFLASKDLAFNSKFWRELEKSAK